jgi:hypothetical protein
VTAGLVGGQPDWAGHQINAFNLIQHSDGFDSVHYVGRHVDPLCTQERLPGYEYVGVNDPVDCSVCLRLLGGHDQLANLIKQLLVELTLIEHSNETLRFALALRGGSRP